jgi:hypothetical protein
MLKADLKESDIPSRSTIRTRILEVFEEHLGVVAEEMKVWSIYLSCSKI